jgi:hypothetical protein
MPDWTETELSAIGGAYELEIASRRHDGSLSPRVPIWAVRVGEDIFIRSVNGPDATWYRNTRTRPTGRIRSGGIERDVSFAPADAQLEDRIDEAYRAKFGGSSSATQRIIAPLARQTTIRLTPATGS